jgi:hypothetical protein
VNATDQHRFARSAAVLSRRVGDGLLLASTADPSFEHLSPTGAAVWAALEAASTVEDVARVVAPAFGVEPTVVEDDVRSLVHQLQAKGFIRQVHDG